MNTRPNDRWRAKTSDALFSIVFLGALAALAQEGVPIPFRQLGPNAQQNAGRGLPPFGAPGLLGKEAGFFQIDRIDGPILRFDAVAEPPLDNPGDLKLDWVVKRTRNAWRRLVIDKVHHQYFGYDLTMEPATFGQYRVTFAPPTIVPDGLPFLTPDDVLAPAPLPKYPDPQLVRAGDTIALDLLVSADGKQKIVDYIRFSATAPAEPPAATTTGEPKDFTVDDGPVKFEFVGFVLVNGQRFAGPTFFFLGKNGGATVWFSFPGEGRYILSLVPHEGFQKMGAVRDNVISFSPEGQQYEVRMKSPIVGAGGAWNLYVLRDPSYQWQDTDTQRLPGNLPAGMPVAVGGVDRLENLLP